MILGVSLNWSTHRRKIKNKEALPKNAIRKIWNHHGRGASKLKGYSVFRFGGFEVMDGKEEELTEEIKKVFNPYFDVINKR
ncbi:hypothetical protein [Bacillus thuringiensis]|uniref:hypothetical protein n=1 Tax=Bacillus thuringiensis TaxID=1428 RepID=UPI002D811273|nr:hypothetical protein [Bacillus thuringiensis]MEB4816846.1 hypothetical protein [Bacillus thuringiensis]